MDDLFSRLGRFAQGLMDSADRWMAVVSRSVVFANRSGHFDDRSGLFGDSVHGGYSGLCEEGMMEGIFLSDPLDSA